MMAPSPSPSLMRIGLISVGVAAAVLALKAGAYWLTGSVALYSDALESIINVAASLAALAALRVASLPADEGHPFGHGKAEYFSAVLEGVLIVLAALAILWEAVPKLLHPSAVNFSALGIGLSLLASLLNGLWARYIVQVGREARSPALTADGRHLFGDVVTSVGVLAGVLLAFFTGWHWLDPLLASAVALHVLWGGWQVTRESVGGLMDAGADPQTRAQIRELVAQHGQGALEAHDILTRAAGRLTFIEFHLVVPGDMTVAESHQICDRLEGVLEKEIAGARVTIHVEPQENAKHAGAVVI